jgi:hypothetical protein
LKKSGAAFQKIRLVFEAGCKLALQFAPMGGGFRVTRFFAEQGVAGGFAGRTVAMHENQSFGELGIICVDHDGTPFQLLVETDLAKN